jgi:hypothetical protein
MRWTLFTCINRTDRAEELTIDGRPVVPVTRCSRAFGVRCGTDISFTPVWPKMTTAGPIAVQAVPTTLSETVASPHPERPAPTPPPLQRPAVVHPAAIKPPFAPHTVPPPPSSARDDAARSAARMGIATGAGALTHRNWTCWSSTRSARHSADRTTRDGRASVTAAGRRPHTPHRHAWALELHVPLGRPPRPPGQHDRSVERTRPGAPGGALCAAYHLGACIDEGAEPAGGAERILLEAMAVTYHSPAP